MSCWFLLQNKFFSGHSYESDHIVSPVQSWIFFDFLGFPWTLELAVKIEQLLVQWFVYNYAGVGIYWPRMPCLQCGCPWWLGEDWDARLALFNSRCTTLLSTLYRQVEKKLYDARLVCLDLHPTPRTLTQRSLHGLVWWQWVLSLAGQTWWVQLLYTRLRNILAWFLTSQCFRYAAKQLNSIFAPSAFVSYHMIRLSTQGSAVLNLIINHHYSCARCSWTAESDGYDDDSNPLPKFKKRYVQFTALLKEGRTADWTPEDG